MLLFVPIRSGWFPRFLVMVSMAFVGGAGERILHAADPQVPEGFVIEKIAGYPLIHRPIFACLDEAGCLYVGESSGENLKRDDMLAKRPHWITRLEDTDGDGVYDKSTRFVENITLPQGCLWYQGSLYVTCPPGIWKFTDTDGDGIADERKEILTGFGFSGNACDTHGPFVSPSGRLYIVQGRHGHEFKDENGVVYSQGKAGRIYSCTPDGKDVRIHGGGGFDNPVEVDFTDAGECIGTVNILYRDRGDCLIHWVEGSVFPREDQADAVAEFKWTGGLLSPIRDVGHTAISGITRYRGAHFGPEFRNRWFHAEFNTHKVRYSELKRTGSTFTADVNDFLTCDDGDFHPTDVLEDADGSLLVLNTGGWFLLGCPTSRIAKPEIYGGVYRVRKTDGPLVTDPRGKTLPKLTSQGNPLEEIVSRLDDPRPAVREQTVRTLRGRPELLASIREELQLPIDTAPVPWSELNSKSRPAHVFAGLLRATSEDPGANMLAASRLAHLPDWNNLPEDQLATATEFALMTLLHARDLVWKTPLTESVSKRLLQSLIGAPPEVFRAGMELAATVCTDRRTPIVQVDDPFLQRFVGTAAGQAVDRFSEHCFIYALIRLNRPVPLIACLSSTSPAVQRAAVIALDQMDSQPLQRGMVVPLLSSANASLQQTALDVIGRHPGWAAETLAVLKTWVKEPELSTDRRAALSGFLIAQLGDPAVQQMTVEVMNDPATSPAARLLFWEALQKSTISAWPETFREFHRDALRASEETDTQLVALRVATQRSLTGFETELKKLSTENQSPLAVRCEAVTALGAAGQPLEESVFQPLLQQLADASSSSDDKTSIGRAIGASQLSASQLTKLTTGLDAAGPLVVPALIKAFTRSSDEAVGQALVAALLKSDATVSLSPDELAGILRRYPDPVREAAKPLFAKLGIDVAAQEARLAELAPLLTGGNAAAGREIFFGQKAACASCHAVGNLGARIGPHLTTIGASRSPQDLLEAIVFPSASFVNGYRTTLVVTVEGKILQGVISAETTDTITLKTQDLREMTLRRDDIEEQRESSTSIMPAGLDRQLTPQELRDLLAFLQSRK